MSSILLIAALLPAIVLMVYVYRKDRVESEPVGLVLRVFFLGAASGILAGLIEGVLFSVVESVLAPGLLLLVIEYFFCVAAVEEACKYACLNTIKKRPEFNYVFDAIVYSVAAALGFAALENVFYVFEGGLETAIMRAILSVPGHAADGVVMGVFFGMARKRQLHGNAKGARSFYWLAFLLPVIEHGFYDAALSTESEAMALLAVVVDLAFIALAFILVRHVASHDEPLHPRGVQPILDQPPLPYGRQAAPERPAFQQVPPVAAVKPGAVWLCPQCGSQNNGNFCPSCGRPRPE